MRTGRLAVGVVSWLAAGTLVSSAAAASDPAWTLRSLGQAALQLPLDQPVAERVVSFDASNPTSSGDKRKRWYLGRLRFALRFDPSSGPGLVYLSLLTNQRAAILVKFKTQRRHGRLRVVWNTVDLLHGRRDHATTSSNVRGEASNFVQDRGLRPGSNELAFRIERYGRARVSAATVLEDSGVFSSAQGPAHLTLQVPVRDRRIGVGDEFSLPYVLRNTGDRSPDRVSIAIEYDRRALTSVGVTTRRLDPHARVWRGRFRLRARRPGSTRVLVGAKSTANRPGAEIAVEVDRAAAGGASGWWRGLGGLGLVLLTAAAIVGLVPRVRSSGPGRSTA